ncbi:hypothetical protein NJC38_18725 [Pseudomonas sp. 21LCFQ010]|uniref:hypothetical protein n=1 Tax=Pseudomonas sp. 21LCFQ010 TaxID=2957506 RepID=UPI002097E60C|nr:hypothetical protein [Pseudomonas sp. 21LCFQ010]MCO8164188.1 hypothetical protein [Pseudomonas sp. 21LCFQ010]
MGAITATSQPSAVLDFFGNEPAQPLPRFAAEHLNSKDGQVPNDHSVDFRVNGRAARLTLVPGTFYPTKTSKPMRRYPGVKEQLVEQSLIQHAALQEQMANGDTSSSVNFTINALGRQLKAMGSTMSNTQIRQALDVLSSTVMMLSYGDDLQLEHRGTLLSAFGRNTLSTAGGNNGDDIWCVKFHALIAESIFNVNSRQCPVDRLKHYSPVGAALLRRIHCIEASGRKPYQFTVQEMKMIAAGLSHIRLAGSMQAIRKELERMQADHYLTCFAVEDVFPPVRGRGRPVPIDYRVTLYPGPQWIKNMKAGSSPSL